MNKLPDSWRTSEAHPNEIGRELMRQLGGRGSVLLVQERWWVVRFLSDSDKHQRHPDTGEVYENPRPWTRRLEVLGSGATLAEVLWFLRGGSVRTMVGQGMRPVVNGKGDWVGFQDRKGKTVPLVPLLSLSPKS